ncbi:hypothetical protein BJ546DRAFT_850293 [Cryomyces antarcticus]
MRPVVRVELYGREEPPLTTAHARDPSRQGSYSRNSSAHLSPYPADEPWDEECPREDSDLSSEHHVSPLTYLSIHRDDGGSWISDAVSAPAGISPGIREQLNYTPMLTLQEQTDQRLVAEKNANVVDWLTHSETGSEVGDGKPHSNITKETQLKNRRRAKSTSDATTNFRSASGLDVNGRLSQQSGLPESSVGFYIDEQSEVDESELSESSIGSESPPAKVDVNEAYNDGSYFPQMGADDSSTLHFYTARPWDDPSAGAEVPVERYQPNTSNAAMMRFSQRAKELDSASLAVTVGSRRRSAGDLDSLFSVKGISKPIIVNEDADASETKKEKRGGLFESLRRSSSNTLKRKPNHPVHPSVQEVKPSRPDAKDSATSSTRKGSGARVKSPPKIDTGVAGALDSARSPSAVTATITTSPWAQAKNVIKRTRSRSDIGKTSLIADLWTRTGGPPLPKLASPPTDGAPRNSFLQVTDKFQGSDASVKPDAVCEQKVSMDLAVSSVTITPTYEGFRAHVQGLNPRLKPYMIARVTQEQQKRYNRLMELKVEHHYKVHSRRCPSDLYCTSQGGSCRQLQPRVGNNDSLSRGVGYQVNSTGVSDDDCEIPGDGTIVAANFPQGVPLPPVETLPAEFECPLCFKVKKFFKPSDWTKHVHEDIQPFTCTFPNCSEPKSFKRKADWVRHENERHRQLEKWTCNKGDCAHTCFRKDNFVQHLVREHKLPEPKVRTSRTASSRDQRASSTGDPEDIWVLVEACRHESSKQTEPVTCVFCGGTLGNLKKLTAHLAKHMEQISMPVLNLIEQNNPSSGAVSGSASLEQHRPHPTISPSQCSNTSRSANMLHQELWSRSTNIADAAGYFQTPSASSQTAFTYPPPRFACDIPNQLLQPPMPQYTAQIPSTYGVQSYPGLDISPRQPSRQRQGQQLFDTGNTAAGSQAYRFDSDLAVRTAGSGFSTGPMASQRPTSVTLLPGYGHQEVFASPIEAPASMPFTDDSARIPYYPQFDYTQATNGANLPLEPLYSVQGGEQYGQMQYPRNAPYSQEQQFSSFEGR